MLDEKQRAQVDRQRRKHFHRSYKVDLDLSCGPLHGFAVNSRVWRPDVTSAIELAKYLGSTALRPRLQRTRVLDMCTGTGIQAVAAAKQGCASITVVDISIDAVVNACRNLVTQVPNTPMQIVIGDLFERVPKGERFDVIICNHPFFEGEPNGQIARCMMDPGNLIRRFLREAPNYLTKDGVIVTAFLHQAGPTNDPCRVAEEEGLAVEEVAHMLLDSGVQRGPFSIYEIQPE